MVIQCIYNKQEGKMIKKLVSHGNSAALIIDKPILDILNVDMTTPLEIATDGKSLIISPVESERRGRKFKAALAKVNKEHRKTLKKLAG
jgi:antitoxin component of MazEF toxin-antitoxin module